MKLRVGKFVTRNAAADPDASKAEGFGSVLDLLNRKIRVLQCRGGKGDKAIGGGSTQFDQGLVLNLESIQPRSHARRDTNRDLC